jgi:hypothetical protein
MVEVFWLHARNLIEFYNSPPRYRASAPDFTTGRLYPDLRQKKGGGLAVENAGEDFCNLINEQICHLKYERAAATTCLS